MGWIDKTYRGRGERVWDLAYEAAYNALRTRGFKGELDRWNDIPERAAKEVVQ